MTKDGRPSRLSDIRYFFGGVHSYLKGHEEEVAFARRLALFLNGEAFSLGAYPALYVLFTPSLDAGAVRVTDYGGDWWQRYTNVGVPRAFPDVPRADAMIRGGLLAALTAIRPDRAEDIARAAEVVAMEGTALRILMKARRTKRWVEEVSLCIAAWPAPSYLHLSLTDYADGAFRECDPWPVNFYLDAFALAGAVKVTDKEAQVLPKPSFTAQLTAEMNGGPLVVPLSAFTPRTRPVFSGLVRLRGQ